MLATSSENVRFVTPFKHIVPMRGEHLFFRIIMREQVWVYASLPLYTLVFFSVFTVGPKVEQIMFMATVPMIVFFVLCKWLVDRIRMKTCGNDGLWILLQSEEGIETLIEAEQLYRDRLPFEKGEHEGNLYFLRRWEGHLYKESRLMAQHQELIDSFVRSGKPRGPR